MSHRMQLYITLWHRVTYNAPGLLCHLWADILVCHPRSHVIYGMYNVKYVQLVRGHYVSIKCMIIFITMMASSQATV